MVVTLNLLRPPFKNMDNTTQNPNQPAASLVSISVDQTALAPVIADRILGMNMAYWYDPTQPAIVAALQEAGIRTLRWPGGAQSDDYHWQTNSLGGGGYVFPGAYFPDFLNYVVEPGGFDLSVTVNYGSNAACDSGADPKEAAAWVKQARDNGNAVSHWTVGNEVYGNWEKDLHEKPHDPVTYASEVAGAFYPQMKAANPDTLVGVVVEPRDAGNWDAIVLAEAKYDFVEYHFYAQTPGQETDSFLVGGAAQQLAAAIQDIKAELAAAGRPDTPIYLGELGSVYANPGKQTSSITQALFAGQALCELMKAGVSRATWWLAFGGCSDQRSGNFSESLYGWQTFGGYMAFSDGLPENGCAGTPVIPVGTLLPTARAYQLLSAVARTGEHVLQTSVTTDPEVRAYAVTNGEGTALVIFNLSQSQTKSVSINLTAQNHARAVTTRTYDKAIYDLSRNNVWEGPSTMGLGPQNLPFTLPLTPWSINVVSVDRG